MSRSGKIIYSDFAFKTDAKEAMRGKIDRALVELITNADDAYGDVAGPIEVHIDSAVEPFTFIATVTDRAIGITAGDMISAFTTMGGRSSKLNKGGSSRGLFGRGAKDVAVFGKVIFKAIKDGKYSELELTNDGDYNFSAEDMPATAENYNMLGLNEGENGLSASVFVQKSIDFPKPIDLQAQLRNNAQLRDLILRREVNFYDFRQPSLSGRLVSSLPIGSVIFETEFSLPGFSGKTKLVLRKLPEAQSGSISETSAHGILVKTGMSTIENTLFGLENRPGSKLIAGEVLVPQIIDVVKKELELDSDSAFSILTKNRDGLQKKHPLYAALRDAIVQHVLPELDKIANDGKSAQKQGAELDQALKVAAASIKSDLMVILKDIDDEEPTTPVIPSQSDFVAIPGMLVVVPGANFSVSLRYQGEGIKSSVLVKQNSSLSEIQVENLLDDDEVDLEWRDHPRLDCKIATISMVAPKAIGDYSLVFAMGDKNATVGISVRERKMTADPAPLTLEFYPDRVTASPGKGKNILLRAPIEFANEEIAITPANLAVNYCPEKVTLTPNQDGSWVEALVHVKTGSDSGELNLTAISAQVFIATATLVVSESSAHGPQGPKFDFQLRGDTDALTRFVMLRTNDEFRCDIFGQHRSFSGVFGPYNEEKGKFENEDTSLARAALATVIAQAFADSLVQIEFDKRPNLNWDPYTTIEKSKKYFEKLVGKLNNSLAPKDS